MKLIHNKQFIPFLILLLLLTSNILKAQSIPDSVVKKMGIRTMICKLYWYNDTLNPANIRTEYYNSKSRIDSVIYQNMKTNTISAQHYYRYNKKNILINQKSIMYYDTPSVFILKKSDIKKQKKDIDMTTKEG
ncbi:MAG: hypothetical protein IT271_14345 [Chitinophagales bacterium]|nr:hypothetical protein [Chitinophagales bacterium]